MGLSRLVMGLLYLYLNLYLSFFTIMKILIFNFALFIVCRVLHPLVSGIYPV
jgi:hypothetical protein